MAKKISWTAWKYFATRDNKLTFQKKRHLKAKWKILANNAYFWRVIYRQPKKCEIISTILIYLAFISHAFQTPYNVCMKGQLPAKAPAYIANAILEQSVGLISISFRPNNTLTLLLVYTFMSRIMYKWIVD